MVSFTHRVARETADLRLWGFNGGPWEMNLRDLSRWAQAAKESSSSSIGPGGAADLVYFQRMRTDEDIKKVFPLFSFFYDLYADLSFNFQMTEVYIEEVGSKWPLPEGQPPVRVTESSVSFGGVTLEKGNQQSNENLLLLRSAYKSLHSLAICVQQKWLSILVRSLAKNMPCF
jgi:midasin (ATPase involved in ribosome maturation)